MPPQMEEGRNSVEEGRQGQGETTPLMNERKAEQRRPTLTTSAALSFGDESASASFVDKAERKNALFGLAAVTALIGTAASVGLFVVPSIKSAAARRRHRHRGHDASSSSSTTSDGDGDGDGAPPPSITKKKAFTGPYKLVERQVGSAFFDYYDFYDGPDSLGSAGYNTYVGRDEAMKAGIANATTEKVTTTAAAEHGKGEAEEEETFVYMSSRPTTHGPRDSVRLEGKRRFDRGLFLLDLAHMPYGPGVWPAWWLTDEQHWPANGEIDIVEGINTQTVAKTALHTSDRCSMYAHVPPSSRTGHWDSATGIPNTFTGNPDFRTWKEADDCWNMAAHQWGNQGCVTISDRNDTLGGPVNANGGGVYALEWDPDNGYIRSWAFPAAEEDDGRAALPPNLKDAIETASLEDEGKTAKGQQRQRVMPDTASWGLPYAYFAVGEATGCSADHFKNMRIVFNLAFCGNVAGNRFLHDCPDEAAEAAEFLSKKKERTDPIAVCDAYIRSDPQALDEAYWKIRGVYVYERELEKQQGGDKKDEESKKKRSLLKKKGEGIFMARPGQ